MHETRQIGDSIQVVSIETSQFLLTLYIFIYTHIYIYLYIIEFDDVIGVSTIDVTGMETLIELRRTLESRGIKVRISPTSDIHACNCLLASTLQIVSP